MSIDRCKTIYAEDVESGVYLDFAMDELCYNDNAESNYAEVIRKKDWWDGETGKPWCTLFTDQGNFDVPADHLVKVRIEE